LALSLFLPQQTVSSVQTFFLAMALHPDIQKKAQDELDRVIGPNRLPDFSDRKDLPYINALVKETMRWNVVLPLGTYASHDGRSQLSLVSIFQPSLTSLQMTMNMMDTSSLKVPSYSGTHGI